MTVYELIQELTEYDANKQVVIGVYGELADFVKRMDESRKLDEHVTDIWAVPSEVVDAGSRIYITADLA